MVPKEDKSSIHFGNPNEKIFNENLNNFEVIILQDPKLCPQLQYSNVSHL